MVINYLQIQLFIFFINSQFKKVKTMKKTLCIFSFIIGTAINIFAQNVGIGLTNPQFPLDINGRTRIRSGGDANNSAGLWLNNTDNTSTPVFMGMMTGNQYGIYGAGLGNWGFNMNTDNGFVGIGVGIFNPEYRLDIAGQMRLRSGGNTSTPAGLWLNNTLNTTASVFIGMANDNTIGFYGRGINRFGLSMSIDNGDVNVTDNINVTGNANVAGNINGRNIGATGSLSTLGNIVATNISTRANITATGDVKVLGSLELGLVDVKYEEVLGKGIGKSLSLNCPSGYRVISGGGGSNEQTLSVTLSRSSSNDTETGWVISILNSNLFSTYNIFIKCTCAKIR